MDCDDWNNQINPEADEICDGLDNNCSGDVDEGAMLVFYPDFDQDGFGDEAEGVSACSPPEGYIVVGDDCDDSDAQTHPGLRSNVMSWTMIVTIEIDEGLLQGIFLDSDGDGYGKYRYSC